MGDDGTRRSTALQTKALAGLVIIMIAAAVIALVFVINGGGSRSVAGGAGPSDVARNSHARAASAAAPGTTSSAAPSAGTRAATSAAPSTTASPSASPASPAPSARTSIEPSTKPSSSNADKIVYYTVRRGDTLTGIGRWFEDHGYLTLYQWNRSIIGADPDLIFPGQRIIVVAHHVGVDRRVPQH